MNRKDFLRLSGADQRPVEYMPIALLLRTGYGVAGYYNTSMNHALEDLIVLLNARLIDLRNRDGEGPVITDFNEFLEKVVFEQYKVGEGANTSNIAKHYGNTIPLAAVSMSDIAVFYPVAQITRLMHLIKKNGAAGSMVTQQPTPGVTPIIAPEVVPQPKAATPVAAASEAEVTPISPPLIAATTSEGPLAPVDQDETLAALAAAAIADPKPLTAEKIDEEDQSIPTFLDFNHKSVVLAVLRTKLW
jgi:hypothetical protein